MTVSAALLAAALEGCGRPPASPPTPVAAPPAPFVRALGTVQDGGLPHAACGCQRCNLARQQPAPRRLIASLALVLPATSRPEPWVYLIDATPDLRRQLDLLDDVRQPPAGRVDRAPIDGVLLTHAHIGHYLGLAFFGFEAVDTRELPVHCTPRMASFLRRNGPWSQLVERGNLALAEHPPGARFTLGDHPPGSVEIGVLQVPHRDEYSDTVGYLLRGPARTLLYVPDTDGWHAWPLPLTEVLAREQVDVAVLDASFYALDELPGRDLATVPHPLISQTMDLLEPLLGAGLEVYFSHLNHSNPALDADGPARREITRRGFAVLADGQEIGL